MIALPNLSVLGFSFVVVVVVFHDKAKRTQQGNLLGDGGVTKLRACFKVVGKVLIIRESIDNSIKLCDSVLASTDHSPIYTFSRATSTRQAWRPSRNLEEAIMKSPHSPHFGRVWGLL